MGTSGLVVQWNPCYIDPDRVFSDPPIVAYNVTVRTSTGRIVIPATDSNMSLGINFDFVVLNPSMSLVASVTCTNGINKTATTTSPAIPVDFTPPSVTNIELLSLSDSLMGA